MPFSCHLVHDLETKCIEHCTVGKEGKNSSTQIYQGPLLNSGHLLSYASNTTYLSFLVKSPKTSNKIQFIVNWTSGHKMGVDQR